MNRHCTDLNEVQEVDLVLVAEVVFVPELDPYVWAWKLIVPTDAYGYKFLRVNPPDVGSGQYLSLIHI